MPFQRGEAVEITQKGRDEFPEFVGLTGNVYQDMGSDGIEVDYKFKSKDQPLQVETINVKPTQIRKVSIIPRSQPVSKWRR